MNTVIKTIVLLILCLGGYQPLVVSAVAPDVAPTFSANVGQTHYEGIVL